MAAKYGSKAKSKVKKAMHERKRGTLKSGRSGKKVKSRKQAIAIGLSQARRAGGKVPSKRGAPRRPEAARRQPQEEGLSRRIVRFVGAIRTIAAPRVSSRGRSPRTRGRQRVTSPWRAV